MSCNLPGRDYPSLQAAVRREEPVFHPLGAGAAASKMQLLVDSITCDRVCNGGRAKSEGGLCVNTRKYGNYGTKPAVF